MLIANLFKVTVSLMTCFVACLMWFLQIVVSLASVTKRTTKMCDVCLFCCTHVVVV